MPVYTYTDGQHTLDIRHPMRVTLDLLCRECGRWMGRKYTVPRVNWNGLKPSDGEYSDTFKKLFATADERRAKFEERHEQHERDGVTKYPATL